MFLVCPGCGEWSNQRPVEGSMIVCRCGYRQSMVLLPLLVFGSADLGQYERLPERRYADAIHTLALVCDDEVLRRRLTARPAWRGSDREEFITSLLEFNRSLRALAQRRSDRVSLLDTTSEEPETSAAQVAAWARETLEAVR